MTVGSATPRRSAGALGTRFMPFADAATPELPLARLLRLSLFQVSVGMAMVLLIGTLNRVMIVELGVPAWLVALMVSLPLVFAPFRAVIGFRSDTTARSSAGGACPSLDGHDAAVRRSCDHALRAARAVGRRPRAGRRRPGWRRPRLPARRRRPAHGADRRAWRSPPTWRRRSAAPRRGAALRHAAGRHGGRAPCSSAPLLRDFSPMRLIQVDPGCGARDPDPQPRRPVEAGGPRPGPHRDRTARPTFRESWRAFVANGGAMRRLVAVGLGTVALQHAGHPARALRRPDPPSAGRRRRPRSPPCWPSAALAGFALAARAARPRRRPVPRRRLRRAGRPPRLRRGDLRRAAARALALRGRHGADRLRRRPVRGRHADRRDGHRPRRPRAAWRSAPGAPCRPRRPASRSRWAA